MSNQPTTSTNEPQTAEYQAAVDNVWFEQTLSARLQQTQWDFESGTTRYERWDYLLELEREINRYTNPVRWNIR